MQSRGSAKNSYCVLAPGLSVENHRGFLPLPKAGGSEANHMAEVKEKYYRQDVKYPPIQCKQFELIHIYLHRKWPR